MRLGLRETRGFFIPSLWICDWILISDQRCCAGKPTAIIISHFLLLRFFQPVLKRVNAEGRKQLSGTRWIHLFPDRTCKNKVSFFMIAANTERDGSGGKKSGGSSKEGRNLWKATVGSLWRDESWRRGTGMKMERDTRRETREDGRRTKTETAPRVNPDWKREQKERWRDPKRWTETSRQTRVQQFKCHHPAGRPPEASRQMTDRRPATARLPGTVNTSFWARGGKHQRWEREARAEPNVTERRGCWRR